jgi:hypothetical protein
LKNIRLLSWIIFLLIVVMGVPITKDWLLQQGHRKIFTAAARPTNFVYVTNSVTGCFGATVGTFSKCAYNLHVNPTAGNLAVIQATWQSSTATAAFACTNNGSWTAIGSPKAGVGANAGFQGQMFYVASLGTGANPELCTLTISSPVSFMSWEYTGYSYSGTLSSLDGTPQYSNTPASGGIATISGLTTAGSSDLISASCLGVVSTCTVGSGYTARDDTNACANSSGSTSSCGGGTTGNSFVANTGQLIEEKTGIAAGAQSATFGTGTTDDVILGLVAF